MQRTPLSGTHGRSCVQAIGSVVSVQGKVWDRTLGEEMDVGTFKGSRVQEASRARAPAKDQVRRHS